MFLQAIAKIAEMLFVSRFDRAQNVDGGNIGTGKSAIMHDLFDARAGGSNLRGEISQTAGTIADDGGEATETSVCDEAALDYATEYVWINVAAGKNKNNSLAGKLREFDPRGKRRVAWRRRPRQRLFQVQRCVESRVQFVLP